MGRFKCRNSRDRGFGAVGGRFEGDRDEEEEVWEMEIGGLGGSRGGGEKEVRRSLVAFVAGGDTVGVAKVTFFNSLIGDTINEELYNGG